MFSNPAESAMAMFLMSLGEFGDYYESFSQTDHSILSIVRLSALLQSPPPPTPTPPPPTYNNNTPFCHLIYLFDDYVMWLILFMHPPSLFTHHSKTQFCCTPLR